jgi:hypothetical protein
MNLQSLPVGSLLVESETRAIAIAAMTSSIAAGA